MHPEASDAFPSVRSSWAAAGDAKSTSERNAQRNMIDSITGRDEVRFAGIDRQGFLERNIVKTLVGMAGMQ